MGEEVRGLDSVAGCLVSLLLVSRYCLAFACSCLVSSLSSIGPERALAGLPAATRSRNVEHAHFRGRCDQLRRSADSLKDAPRIVSEAAVVGRPLSTIYADPETLPLSHGVCDGSTVSRTRKGGRRYGYGSGRACDLDLKGVGHAPRPPHPDSERARRGSGSPGPLPTEGRKARPFCVCQAQFFVREFPRRGQISTASGPVFEYPEVGWIPAAAGMAVWMTCAVENTFLEAMHRDRSYRREASQRTIDTTPTTVAAARKKLNAPASPRPNIRTTRSTVVCGCPAGP